MAARVKDDAGMTVDGQIERAFRIAYGRQPSGRELASSRSFFERQAALSSSDAALVDLCHVLLNSNEFLYLE
jgi:hypothetical protein